MSAFSVDVIGAMREAGGILGKDFNHDETTMKLLDARAAVAELIEGANAAHMALIGYLPAHHNAVTDAAIAKVSAALARVGGAQ